MNTAPIEVHTSTTSLQNTHRYASFLRRFVAVILDTLILGIISLVCVVPFAIFEKDANTTMTIIRAFFQILSWVIGPVYMIYFLYAYGATPGKKALHIQVISTTDEKLTVGRLMMREIVGKFLSRFFGDLGFLWSLFDEKRQAWHDKLAHTVVIDTREITPEAYLLWKAKQKSYLPNVLLLNALIPFFVSICLLVLPTMISTSVITDIPPQVPSLVYGVGAIFVALTVLHIGTAIWLFKKQKGTAFLKGTPTKVGIGVLLSSQILMFLLVMSFIIASIFFYVQSMQQTRTSPPAREQYNTYEQYQITPAMKPTITQ